MQQMPTELETKEREPWYALQTRPRSEHSTATILAQKGYEVFYPTQREKATPRRPEPPLFPGYLFCRMSDRGCGLIVSTPGVIRLLGLPGKPQAVREDEVEGVRRMIEAGRPEVCPMTGPGIGRRVRILRGPLRGVVGEVAGEMPEQRLVVSIQLLQRAVSVSLDPGWLAPDGPLTD